MKTFNPKLTEWLNARGFVSADWPYNVSEKIWLEAEKDLANGRQLDEQGYEVEETEGVVR